MFTGLVQGKGRIQAVDSRAGQARFQIMSLFSLDTTVPGESIAVNGACLTVETPGKNAFSAYASAETLSRTNLGALRSGSIVNLERALALGDRLGGHLVSGHIDCLAKVSTIDKVGESTQFTLTFPKEYGSLVVEKGSVALDGISLTVNTCGANFLSVNIIPTTIAETTIQGWAPGTTVNMETDVIGKYVQKMVAPWTTQETPAQQEGITEAYLRELGF